VTSRTKGARVSLERRTYRELPSGKYHLGLLDIEGNTWLQVACPARPPLVDVNDESGSVPDAMVCPICFRRD